MRSYVYWRMLPTSRLSFLLGLVLTATVPAFGTLGENVSSVSADQAHLKATVRVIARQFYSVHEMRTPVGTLVRQYVSPSGMVFGVSWQGFSPDLQQLLGSYFDQYIAAANAQPGRHGRGVHIETGDLVLDTGGHMRFAVGRAFLRNKLPQGVSPDDVQ